MTGIKKKITDLMWPCNGVKGLLQERPLLEKTFEITMSDEKEPNLQDQERNILDRGRVITAEWVSMFQKISRRLHQGMWNGQRSKFRVVGMPLDDVQEASKSLSHWSYGPWFLYLLLSKVRLSLALAIWVVSGKVHIPTVFVGLNLFH